MNSEQFQRNEKLASLRRVAAYRPLMTIGIILLSFSTAVLEGIGLSFLFPIIELAQAGSPPSDPDTLMSIFIRAYRFIGIPLTLDTILVGVGIVFVTRYLSSFSMMWLRAKLRTSYVRWLQTVSFEHTLDARVSYFDEEGSDDILNAIVTQATYAGQLIDRIVQFVQQFLLSIMYFGIALYLGPLLTIGAALVLGFNTFLLRGLLESGYAVGDRVAEANERVQEAVQAGTQGIRDVKLFSISDELLEKFDKAVAEYEQSNINLKRNQAALDNIYQLIMALTVFVLIYVAVVHSSLSIAGLGVFLFAMFRLAPRVSTLNKVFYRIEGDLPHLIRTHRFIDKLKANHELTGDEDVPDVIEEIGFDEVVFSYDEEKTLSGISFRIERGEFVAFVGPSGAGKSTIVSMISQFYWPDEGQITANGYPIRRFNLYEWRSRIAVVRQRPYVFNDTLRNNVTIGNRGAPESEIKRVCEIAQVTEFSDKLPNGFDTNLGDDGVRLSGGQRQRVAIARALLSNAEILILDEATSDLDSTLEEKVHAGIESFDGINTMIVIAHRLSTVTNADRIYTMEAGEITEVGKHSELIEQDGTYAKLYVSQRQ